MAAPYVREYTVGGLHTTSVVIDQTDFDSFIDELAGVIDIVVGGRAGANELQRLKDAKFLPLMKRGTRTEKFFERWNVKTDLLSVIVRGTGPGLLSSILK